MIPWCSLAYGPRHPDDEEAFMRWEYDTEVNKGSINMGQLKDNLNRRGQDGWHLSPAFTQEGNTVLIFEREVR